MSEADGSVFVISKNDPNFELISKCVSAVQRGSLGSLTQANFDEAIAAVTKAFAADAGISEADAAEAVLSTELGSMLYTGYVSASVAKVEQPVTKAVEEEPCCAAIHKAADAIRQEGETEACAIRRALLANPSLYTEYLRARGQS